MAVEGLIAVGRKTGMMIGGLVGGMIGSEAGVRGMAAVVVVLLGGGLCSSATPSSLGWLRLGGGGSGALRAFIFGATGVEPASLVAAAAAPKRETLGDRTDAVDWVRARAWGKEADSTEADELDLFDKGLTGFGLATGGGGRVAYLTDCVVGADFMGSCFDS